MVSVDRLRRLGRASLVAANLAVLLLLVATATLIWMERGWAQRQFRGVQDAFLHGTIGTEVMPLVVAQVLPDIFPENFQPAGTDKGDWIAHFMFLVHSWWAVFVIFHGVKDAFVQMGIPIAGTNFLLLGWWGLDVVLLWTVRSYAPRMARFQRATRVFAFLVFALMLIVLRAGPARALGYVFVGVVALALAVRFWASDRLAYARA